MQSQPEIKVTVTAPTTAPVSVVPSYSLAAAVAPLKPARALFEREEPDQLTPMTYEDGGAVYGHLAPWDVCHAGLSAGAFSECVVAPRSATDYSRFHLGEIETAEGDRIAVGKIVLATGHAPMTADLTAATKHYDDTGSVGAFVRARNGRLGIWVSGVVRSDLSPEHLRDLRANSVSGDWRSVNRSLELVAALAVPVPGFPVPRSQLALSASGEISAMILSEVPEELVAATYSARQRMKRRKLSQKMGSLTAAVLTTKKRKSLSRSSFAIPEQRAYPIHDRAHAANALARSSGKSVEGRVRAAVCRRYPDMCKK